MILNLLTKEVIKKLLDFSKRSLSNYIELFLTLWASVSSWVSVNAALSAAFDAETARGAEDWDKALPLQHVAFDVFNASIAGDDASSRDSKIDVFGV